jgi:hypothetical protein
VWTSEDLCRLFAKKYRWADQTQLLPMHGYQATRWLAYEYLFRTSDGEEYPDCKFGSHDEENSEVPLLGHAHRSITETNNMGGRHFTGVRQYSHYLRWLSVGG